MTPYDSHLHLIGEIHKKSSLSKRLPILLGASKAQPADKIELFIDRGLTHFGENRVQEAMDKWPDLKKRHPHVTLHLIGPLQTNKVKEALSLFDVIQTVDRPKLAEAIAKEMPRNASAAARASLEQRPMGFSAENSGGKKFFIQVNTGEEPQKSGVLPKEAPALIALCRKLELNVVGLMCVPPAHEMPAPHFALLRKIALDNGLSELSMGMSSDYETAIRMGSTCVRLGTALFGERS